MGVHNLVGNQLVSVRAPKSPTYRTIIEDKSQLDSFVKKVTEELTKDKYGNINCISCHCTSEAEILEKIKRFKTAFEATGLEWNTLSLWDEYENLIGWYASFKVGKIYFDNGCLSYN